MLYRQIKYGGRKWFSVAMACEHDEGLVLPPGMAGNRHVVEEQEYLLKLYQEAAVMDVCDFHMIYLYAVVDSCYLKYYHKSE